MARQILDLTTLYERDTIRIDGTPYELRSPAEFTILEYLRIGKRGQALQALQGKFGEITEDEVAQLSSALDEACRLVLIAPDEVHAKLRDHHRQAIIGAFTDAAAEARGAEAAPEAQPAATSPSTGESTSPV
jgi:hypothetical protein